MTTIDMLRDRLFEKLEDLEPDKLSSVIDFVDFLIFQQNTNRTHVKPKTIENRAALVEDMKQLFRETQALAGVSEITDEFEGFWRKCSTTMSLDLTIRVWSMSKRSDRL